MTRITEISVHRTSLPLVRPFVTARRRATTLETVLVSVTDSDGVTGWGEAPTSWRVTGESAASVDAVVRGPLGDAVLGLDSLDTDAASERIIDAVVGNAAARSAVESAVVDLAARLSGATLARFLGAAPEATRISTDLTLAAGPVESLLADARAGAAFPALKIKVGLDADADRDAVIAVRREIGPDVRLRVDANQGWTASDAIRVIRAWEEAGVDLEFVEQPTPARDLAALASVTSAVSTPILADESVWTTSDLHDLVEQRAADAVNIKLAKCGGPVAALDLARAARAAGMGIIVGSMLESTVGVGTSAAVAAALDANAVHDLDAGAWIAASPVDGGIRYDGGSIALSTGAGLGIRGLAAPLADGSAA
ncbi:dipeptide epimerase [Agromyces atrinae]|uniref:mandelate racemase/muconate lactonizing enzyme family protein n=1 Tax=Agromyces atrinae TaxID=592376 RepID=UPI001F57C338|nr:dipeptide epimerase [Agromyces atrinae]MCI2957187.1 dipeptide epimerase [Agromyces atrinae]